MDDKSDSNQKNITQVEIRGLVYSIQSVNTLIQKTQEETRELHKETQQHYEHFIKMMSDEIRDGQKESSREFVAAFRDISHQSILRHKEQMKETKMHGYILAFITIVLVLGTTFFGGYYSSVLQTKAQKSAVYQKQAQRIDAKIATLEAVKNKFAAASINLRGIRNEDQQYCVNGQYAGPYKKTYRHDLFVSFYSLIGTLPEIMDVFDAEVAQQTKLLIAMFSSSVDKAGICAKGVATDNILFAKQSEIQNLMIESINQLKQKRKAINEKIRIVNSE